MPSAAPDLVPRIVSLVTARTGLAVEDAQARRRLARALTTGNGLEGLAEAPDDSPAWQAVVDALTVPETYLFRELPQLELMVEAGLLPGVAGAQGKTIRLWSAGCCTGEEAYTLAVLALQSLVAAGHARETAAGVVLAAGWELDVLGTDISLAALDRARIGSYATGELSAFRSAPPEYLRFFPGGARGDRRVRDDVRAHVRFLRAGLTERWTPGAAEFDVVACRNVLVYMTEAARRSAVAVLSDAVRPGGVLLLGPTDPAPDRERFTAVWGRGALVHRRDGPPA